MNDPWLLAIDDYLDDALPAAERVRMEQHLESCSRCREALEDEHRLRRRLLAIAPVEVPADLGDRIRHRLGEAGKESPRHHLGARRWAVLTSVGLAAAAVFAGVLLLLPPVRDLPPDPQKARAPRAPAEASSDFAADITADLASRSDPALARGAVPESALASPRPFRAVLEDWLRQAENAAPADASLLVAEARMLELLPAIRKARSRSPSDGMLRRAEDVLLQLVNDPLPAALPAEARLVAGER